MRKELWEPSKEYMKKSNMYSFMGYVNQKHSLEISDYRSLYQWSVDSASDFWESLWHFLISNALSRIIPL